MKKFYTLYIFTLIGYLCQGQIVTIPDANFKAKLIAGGVDTNSDGEIQESEALNTTALYLDSANIYSLEGIQSFANVTSLWCSYNPLTEINLCGTAVATLFCNDNPNLTSIILKNNVISATIWMEPPFPPFWAQNLPSLQYICCDAGEMAEAQIYFDSVSSNTITFTSDCDISNCAALLHAPHPRQDLAVSVYPNPVDAKLTVALADSSTLKSISIYNTLGQLVQVITNPTQTIDVSGLKTGSYFIKIVSDKGTATEKFIKK